MKFTDFNKNKKRIDEAAAKRKVLSHLQHSEDLLFDHGYDGVEKALEFYNMVRESLAQGEGPVKKNITVKYDGCIHPDTVLLTEEGEMTIQQIIDAKRPINVLTHNLDTGENGFQLAFNPRINDNDKNWIEIEMENGHILKLTEDHEVYVKDKGWVEAKNLQEGDDILDYKV